MPPPNDAVIGALISLAETEFQAGRHRAATALACLIRDRAPHAFAVQNSIALASSQTTLESRPQPPSAADECVALGWAYQVLGEHDSAAANFRAALTFDGNAVHAHIGLAELRLPGDFYYVWLERFYTLLSPETVIEIGVADGASLAQVRPPTVAIGVDPEPRIVHALTAECHIFSETSDAFFARRGPDALLAGRPLGVGFIDGLHLYEQALKDFINIERYCGQQSVILFHDTLPLDEATQSRTRDTQFHTGDVWKVVPCLKHYRPDLDVFTIATPWTGLTVVTGLDGRSHALSERYEEAVARFIDAPFSEIDGRLGGALNLVPNDWNFVAARLKLRGVF
jgi:tetratricopeptide (TPR) repeat protein